MGQGKAWKPEEINKLYDLWGEKTIPQIADILGRSCNAVNVKAKRLKLQQQINGGELLCAQYVSKMMGVDIHTVTDYWILKCGLKGKKQRVLHRGHKTIIKLKHLLKWLRENPDKWDSRRVDKYGLGFEYDWLTEKRKADALLPKKRNMKWTPAEDERLKVLFRSGDNTLQQIGIIMGRPYAGVKHRLTRIDVWGTNGSRQNISKVS